MSGKTFNKNMFADMNFFHINKTYYETPVISNKNDICWSIEHTLNDEYFFDKEEHEKKIQMEKKIREENEAKLKKLNEKPDLTFSNNKWYKNQLKKIFYKRKNDFHFKSEYYTLTFDGEFKDKKFTWQEFILKDDYERMQCFPQMWNRYYRLRVEQQYIGLYDTTSLAEYKFIELQKALENIPYEACFEKFKIEKELFNDFDLKEGDIDFEDEEEDSFSSSDEDSL